MDALTFMVMLQQDPHAIVDLGSRGALAHAACLEIRRHRTSGPFAAVHQSLNLEQWEPYDGRKEDTFGCMFCLKPF